MGTGWRARGRRLARFVSIQVLVQALSFAAGVILVRIMEPLEYGYYTLAVSAVATAAVLMDLGLGTAVLAVGGRFANDRERLRDLVGDARAVQRRLLWVGGAFLLPVFVFLLAEQKLDGLDIGVLSLLVLGWTAINVRVQNAVAVMRLRGDLADQQRLDVGTNALKLVLVAFAAAMWVDARLALIINLLAAVASLYFALRYIHARLGPTGRPSRAHTSALWGLVRRQAPNSLYYCLNGQIATWMVAWLGDAERVAQVGALGRLALIFAVVGSVVASLAQPYFARTVLVRELVSAFVALNACFMAITVALTLVALLAPESLLWILGPRYRELKSELVWVVLSASLASWSGAVYAVSAARGWIVPGALVIASGVLSLAVSVRVFDLSTVGGAFMMSTAGAAVATVLTVTFASLRLAREPTAAEPCPT